jgi:N-carbamoylputrescine amidase
MARSKSSISNRFRIGLIQIKIGNNPNDNLKKAINRIERAAKKDAQVICLPELFRSQYFCQTEDIKNFNLAESIPGPTTDAISKICKKYRIVVVVSIFEKRATGIYHNTAVIINIDGEIIGTYRKMHIPDDPSYYEKFYFTPGDLGYKSYLTKFGKISTLICWDQWYPEAARLTAMQGPTIIFYPTAIGWHPYEKKVHGKAQIESWQTVQRGHAIANGVYVAAVNRIGLEKPDSKSAGIEFWGSSFVSDPQGVIIAQASTNKEEILITEINTDRIEYIRRNWPFLRDRRIDSYNGITKRFLD